MPLIRIPSGSLAAGTTQDSGGLLIAPQAPATPLAKLYAEHVNAGHKIRSIYNGATRNNYFVEILGGAVPTADFGTGSDGSDDDGSCILMTGGEGNGNSNGTGFVNWTSGQIQRRWGAYAWTRFKLPSTMTNLANRSFGNSFFGDSTTTDITVANLSGAAAQSYITLRWRHGTNGANWSIRVANGANAEDALDTGVAIQTNVLYHAELLILPGSGDVYFSMNGGAIQQVVSSLLPTTTFNFTNQSGLQSINNAAVTGTGGIVHRQYSSGMLAA